MTSAKISLHCILKAIYLEISWCSGKHFYMKNNQHQFLLKISYKTCIFKDFDFSINLSPLLKVQYSHHQTCIQFHWQFLPLFLVSDWLLLWWKFDTASKKAMKMVKTIFLIKQQENVKKVYVNIHKVAFFILNSPHQNVMNCDVPT